MDLKHAKHSNEKLAMPAKRVKKQRDSQPVTMQRQVIVLRPRIRVLEGKPEQPLIIPRNRISKHKQKQGKQTKQLAADELSRKVGTRKLHTQYDQGGIGLATSLSKITCSIHEGKSLKVKRRKAPRNTLQQVRLSSEKELGSNRYGSSRGNSAEAAQHGGKARKQLGTLISRIKSSQHTLTTALSEKKLSDNSCEQLTSQFSKRPAAKPLKRPKAELKPRKAGRKQSERLHEHQNRPPCDQPPNCQLKCSENLQPIQLGESRRLQSLPTDSDSKHLSVVRCALQQRTSLDDFLKNQHELTPKIRAVLVDWLFRITSEMLMQRQTVSLALHYLDQYLQRTTVPKLQYQLMAVAALLIAYKQEHSHHEKFVQVLLASCQHGYSQAQLLEAEMKLALGLQFKLNPPTYNFWLEYLTARWDRYLQKKQFLKITDQISEQLRHRFTDKPLKFRDSSPESYALYRQLLQLIDTSLYCESTVRKFQRPRLVTAGIYLLLRCQLDLVVGLERMLLPPSYDKHMNMYREFQQPNSPIFRDRLHFNPLFNHYLTELCMYELADIVPEIKYLAGLLDMPFQTSLPQSLCSCEQMTYEQFLRYQIHSETSLRSALRRL